MIDDRKDAWCAELDEARRWQVYNAHAAAKSWEACAEWAAAEFGVRLPTQSAYYRFRQRMAARESEHRIELAITEKARIGREMEQIGEITPELRRAFEQRALESELRGDHQGAEKWLALSLELGEAINRKREQERKEAELQLKRQAESRAGDQLRLQREKFEAAERRIQAAREAVARLNESGGLSAEGRAEIERAMGVL